MNVSENEGRDQRKTYPIERRLIVLPGFHCQTGANISTFTELLSMPLREHHNYHHHL